MQTRFGRGLQGPALSASGRRCRLLSRPSARVGPYFPTFSPDLLAVIQVHASFSHIPTYTQTMASACHACTSGFCLSIFQLVMPSADAIVFTMPSQSWQSRAALTYLLTELFVDAQGSAWLVGSASAGALTVTLLWLTVGSREPLSWQRPTCFLLQGPGRLPQDRGRDSGLVTVWTPSSREYRSFVSCPPVIARRPR